MAVTAPRPEGLSHTYDSYAVVDAVGYVQVTLPVDPTTVRALQPGVGSFATVAVAALVAPGLGNCHH
jgi:hypothetical protein